jgi:predicted house-cleaning noncanonical NTP pyrophosphatase (MazG superfamily)
MKYIFRCEKLVRDRTPELISGEDCTVEVETLDRKAHISELKKKLKEEALEVDEALTRVELIEEIADVIEVLDALTLKLSISKSEIEEARRKKSIKRGGFIRGLYLKTVSASIGSPIAEYYLKQPTKYPLIESPSNHKNL